jgi:hypothetical protein
MNPTIQVLSKYLSRSWQRSLIAGICVLIVFARIIFPGLNVDWISVVLLIIAMTAFVLPRLNDMLPYVVKVLPYIKKAKLAGIEIELSDEIQKLAKDVDKAQEALGAEKNLKIASEFTQGEAEVLKQIKTDPRAALLLLAARIEQQVMLQLERHGLWPPGTFLPPRRAIELGVQHQVFPNEILAPFNEFWSIRNEVAHAMAFGVDTSLIMSLISVGLQLLKLISVEEGHGPSSSE